MTEQRRKGSGNLPSKDSREQRQERQPRSGDVQRQRQLGSTGRPGMNQFSLITDLMRLVTGNNGREAAQEREEERHGERAHQERIEQDRHWSREEDERRKLDERERERAYQQQREWEWERRNQEKEQRRLEERDRERAYQEQKELQLERKREDQKERERAHQEEKDRQRELRRQETIDRERHYREQKEQEMERKRHEARWTQEEKERERSYHEQKEQKEEQRRQEEREKTRSHDVQLANIAYRQQLLWASVVILAVVAFAIAVLTLRAGKVKEATKEQIIAEKVELEHKLKAEQDRNAAQMMMREHTEMLKNLLIVGGTLLIAFIVGVAILKCRQDSHSFQSIRQAPHDVFFVQEDPRRRRRRIAM